MKEQEAEKVRRDINLVSVIAAMLCLALIVLYMVFDIHRFKVDGTVLILFFAGLGSLFFRFLSKVKIGDWLEIERLEEEVKEVKRFLYRGQIVRTERGERFYIDNEGKRYSVPDDHTARFLQSDKGEISVSDKEVEPYPIRGEMESVLTCRLLWWNRTHIFAILKGKKYHVGSASYLADWQRVEDYEACDDREIKKYPTGR